MDILIVEDEVEIAQLIQLYLEKEGFSCRVCSDGQTAIRVFQELQPDLIILDLMLPELDGLEVCARIRQKPGSKDPYILMLTAKGEEIDRIIGLSTGADDYMVKPFSPRELVARVRALLRRSQANEATMQPPGLRRYAFEGWLWDVDARSLIAPDGSALDLTGGEHDLLLCLVERPQRVLSREQLLDWTRGREAAPFDRTIDVQLGRVRRKLARVPKTVRGGGYVFVAPVRKV